jgi:uncharacterized RDD family membrane protein YckC
MRIVSPSRRLAYGSIDIVIYTLATIALAGLFGWQPRLQFMQAYTEDQQNEYWGMLWLAFGLVTLISVTCHALFGQSVGKWLLGVRTVRENGSPLGLSGALKRLGCMISLAALVFLPGPLVGFSFGQGSEWLSSTLLMLAFVALPIIAVKRWHPDGSPWLQHYFGFRTIVAQTSVT